MLEEAAVLDGGDVLFPYVPENNEYPRKKEISNPNLCTQVNFLTFSLSGFTMSNDARTSKEEIPSHSRAFSPS